MHSKLSISTFCILLLFSLGAVSAPGQSCIDPAQIDLTVACTGEWDPVCSCEGIDYSNPCEAVNWNGVTAWTPGECTLTPDTCEAGFVFMYMLDGSVFLQNTSPAYAEYTWYIAGESIAGDTSGQLFYTPQSEGAFVVCLQIRTESGCESSFCRLVYPDSPAELCHITDCVWPGDANHDWKANNYDLLHIGLGFGINGQPRPFFPFPENPNAWAPNFALDWLGNINSVNTKHLDSNGDGHVDEADIEAIELNYSPDFDYTSEPTPGAPPIYLEFDENSIEIDENTPELVEITADLIIGSAEQPVYNFYGFAMNFLYPDELVEPHSVTIDYNDNSFFGPINQVITVNKDLSPQGIGRFDLAFSRVNGQGVNGFGVVATVRFIVNADIIDGRSEPVTPFPVPLQGIKMINSNNDTLDYDLPAGASLSFINTTITAINEEALASFVQVFPNPTKGMLQVDLDPRISAQSIEVLNSSGQKILSQTVTQPNLHLNIPVPGIYFLRIRSGAGVAVRRVVVQ